MTLYQEFKKGFFSRPEINIPRTRKNVQKREKKRAVRLIELTQTVEQQIS